MKRQDIRLLAEARKGDVRARCEVGRRYLLGVDGFARHVPSGLAHLREARSADPDTVARVLAEGLPLHELIEAGEAAALARAAADGSALAQLRHGAWLCAVAGGDKAALVEGQRWLTRAARAGLTAAEAALQAAAAVPAEQAALAVLRSLSAAHEVDGLAVAQRAVTHAREGGDLVRLTQALNTALALAGGLTPELAIDLAALVLQAQAQAQARGQLLRGVDETALREALEQRAHQGDRDVAYVVGRAMCGIAVPGLPASVFAEHQNVRQGATFILRAADAGEDEAWLHLYTLHADHGLSVANPSMARFFLEKAALRGRADAQRKLGALLLRGASSIIDTEQAIHWLHAATGQGDAHAEALLRSLVLPVEGSDAEAAWALAQLRSADPLLAARVELARAFGLTKLEALSVDPVDGLRPWGIVVGRNPFIVQVRLSAPRAIPALTPQALQVARRAALLFQQLRGDGASVEGDLRNRSLRQRRSFERLGLDEALFFADASSMTLETLRLGAKWAHRARQPLSDALAA